MKKFTALLLAFTLIFAMVVPSFAKGKELVITNPYDGIDFAVINQYKTALHTHTNATDGDPTLYESVQRHYETGFDIVATTDHGTVNYSWETENPNKLIHGVMSLIGKSEGKLKYLGKSGKFENGASYNLVTENGDDYLVLSDGTKILRVPYGIEQNAISVNAHVNSWFTDFNQDKITTYEDAIKGVDKAGGVSVINHPGEYSKARYEIHAKDAYNTKEFAYWYLVNKWAKLLDKYDSCIGVDVNSKGDDRTKYDRVLWDELLTRFSANGKNVFGICSSDAHQLDKIDTGFIYALMPELSSTYLRKSLENGWFFGASHSIGSYEELMDINSALVKYYGESDLTKSIKETTDAMAKKIADIENGNEKPDANIGITYKCLDSEGFCNAASQPMITNIAVDGTKITISTSDALIIRWISDGKLIATQKADDTAFNLADYTGSIGNYIRAEVFGAGGIIYTQAFLINAKDNAGKASVTDTGFFDFGIFDFLVGTFANWGDILGRVFKVGK